mmetsp:Transcript_4392/g.17992  ORF Transcript_4392/g.17992 Transcript_4392/m.17992 type:complete len:315 (-) Transcript_4392:3778-4722(-)
MSRSIAGNTGIAMTESAGCDSPLAHSCVHVARSARESRDSRQSSRVRPSSSSDSESESSLRASESIASFVASSTSDPFSDGSPTLIPVPMMYARLASAVMASSASLLRVAVASWSETVIPGSSPSAAIRSSLSSRRPIVPMAPPKEPSDSLGSESSTLRPRSKMRSRLSAAVQSARRSAASRHAASPALANFAADSAAAPVSSSSPVIPDGSVVRMSLAQPSARNDPRSAATVDDDGPGPGEEDPSSPPAYPTFGADESKPSSTCSAYTSSAGPRPRSSLRRPLASAAAVAGSAAVASSNPRSSFRTLSRVGSI